MAREWVNYKRPAPDIEYMEDFFSACVENGGKISETGDQAEWLLTVIDGGTDNGEIVKAADDAHGGLLTLTCNDADNDALELQLNGESFALNSGKNLNFECRFAITDMSETDWFVGLAITDTDVLGAVTDSIGFRCPDGTGDIDTVAEMDSTETAADSGVDLVDATYVVVRVEIKGTSRARFYVDGVEVADVTTNLPTDEALTPTLCVRNDGAVAQTMTVDYVRVWGDR